MTSPTPSTTSECEFALCFSSEHDSNFRICDYVLLRLQKAGLKINEEKDAEALSEGKHKVYSISASQQQLEKEAQRIRLYLPVKKEFNTSKRIFSCHFIAIYFCFCFCFCCYDNNFNPHIIDITCVCIFYIF